MRDVVRNLSESGSSSYAGKWIFRVHHLLFHWSSVVVYTESWRIDSVDLDLSSEMACSP